MMDCPKLLDECGAVLDAMQRIIERIRVEMDTDKAMGHPTWEKDEPRVRKP